MCSNPEPGWRNWQTQRAQNPPRFTPRGGSTPPPGTSFATLLKAPFAVSSLHALPSCKITHSLMRLTSWPLSSDQLDTELLLRYPGEIPTDKKLCHCCMMGVFHGYRAGLESVALRHRDNFRSVVIGHQKGVR